MKRIAIAIASVAALILPFAAFAITFDSSTYAAPALVAWTGATNGYGYDMYYTFDGNTATVCSSDSTGWVDGPTGSDLSAATWNGVANCFPSSTVASYSVVQETAAGCHNGGLTLAQCEVANPGYILNTFNITAGGGGRTVLSPMNDTSATASRAALVDREIVSLPIFELQNYETPLVGIAIMIVLFSTIFGLLRFFNYL